MEANFLLKRELVKELAYGRDGFPNFPVHFHSHIEIYLIRSGAVEVLINDQRKVLRGGEISVALSYDAHGYRTVEQGEALYLIIPTTYCSELLPFLTNTRTHMPFIDDPATYQTVLDAMEKICDGTDEISRRGYVYIVLGAILNQLPIDEQQNAPTHGFSSEILIYISQHFREELTLAMVARVFGYHPSYLSRIFRQKFGISFGKYLTMLRLREAVLLLRTEKMNVTECAMESGFGSMRNFYRAFREEFGCTPKEYFDTERKKQH